MRRAAILQRGAPATGVMQKALRPTLFAGMLLLGAYLRVAGLTWGLNSGYGQDLNFQPDEFVSLKGVRQLDLLTGDFKAADAYFEGTFNYYLWAVPQAVLKTFARDGHRSQRLNRYDRCFRPFVYLQRNVGLVRSLHNCCRICRNSRSHSEVLSVICGRALLCRFAHAGDLCTFYETSHSEQSTMCASYLVISEAPRISSVVATCFNRPDFRLGSSDAVPSWDHSYNSLSLFVV